MEKNINKKDKNTKNLNTSKYTKLSPIHKAILSHVGKSRTASAGDFYLVVVFALNSYVGVAT